MTEREQALALLRSSTGLQQADFRDGQWEAISSLVNLRERQLVVQRTGWGKSNVYFIATRILRDAGSGPTLIVSPLLALMRDQKDAAERIGVAADTINSSNPREHDAIFSRFRSNRLDALLISPERLANEKFVEDELLPVMDTFGLGLLVVDEAHCISDWGHEFRPDYRRIVNVVRRLPDNIPVLATTATANDRVIGDVLDQMGNIGIHRGPLARESLALQVMRMPSSVERLAWLADHIEELPGTGIIYTLTRRDATQVSDWLNQNNIPALPYFSGVTGEGFKDTNEYRLYLEDQLLNNKIKALVATVALGMGFDKPDLGFVVHYQAPGSIVAYYQQVGRAGRAIDHAVGVLLTGREDEEIQEYFRSSAFPAKEWVDQILKVLQDSDGLTLRELEGQLNLRNKQIDDALKYLSVESPAPVARVVVKDGNRQRTEWRRAALEYQMDTEKIQRLTRQREQEWEEIQEYIDAPGCLMEYLAKSLDDPNPLPCGKCASCLGRLIVGQDFRQETAIQAAMFLRHSEFELRCPVQITDGSFPAYKFSVIDSRGNLSNELRAQRGKTLCRWGDAAWGRVVAEDKHSNHFRDELVNAMATMITDRWRPDPAPTWVTCIPSLGHPMLVPGFASRLAERLGLPFVQALAKIKQNGAQKEQQNRFYQCWNLDGVFEVQGDIPSGPVLLVDDIVDSGWTLTVGAALLLRKGSGPVFPVALASSGTD